jgi:hypothetical protein
VSGISDLDEDDYWTDERLAAMTHLNKAGRALALSLISLTVEAACEFVAQHPGLSVLFMYPGHGYPAAGFSVDSRRSRYDLVVSAH